MTEEWRPVVGYEGLYEVSDLGRLKRLARITEPTSYHPNGRRYGEQILDPARGSGYRTTRLYRNGDAQTVKIATLVCEAFHGPRPEGMVTCHWNDVRDDDRAANLRWGTLSDNARDAVRNGRRLRVEPPKPQI